MRSDALIVVVSAALLCGCGTDVEPIPSRPGNPPVVSDKNSEAGENADLWAALADSCTYVLIESFMNKSQGTFYGTPNDIKGTTWNMYWQQHPSIDVILASYQRIKDTNPTLAEQYLTYFTRWYENDANNYNNSYDNVEDYGGFYNDWTDDMDVICLSLINMSDVLGDDKYADTARKVFVNYIWPRATTRSDGTALPWTSHEVDVDNRNSTANICAGLLAVKLYERYKVKWFLTVADMLYSFNVSKMPDDERAEEPPLSYTQGYLAETCRLLYHITGDTKYRDMATRLLRYTFTSTRCVEPNTRALRHEGTDDNQSIFKAVLIPYTVNYVLDDTMPEADRTFLHDMLIHNARVLSRNLNRRYYPQMYINYFWGEPFTT